MPPCSGAGGVCRAPHVSLHCDRDPPPKSSPAPSQIDMSIVGWHSKIGAWSRLENYCVLGEDVQCKVGGRKLHSR